MKRIAAFVITLAMMLSLGVFGAAAGDEILSGSDYIGFMTGHWDTIKLDGAILGEDGGAVSYIIANDSLIEAKAETLTVRGWIVCDTELIGFGYRINKGAAVFKDEFKIEAEEGVKKVAEEKEVDYYARFEITVNVSELKGTNELTFLVKNGDGVYTIYTDSNIEVSLDFLQEGTEEEPTATPDTGAKNEPVLVRFNDSDAAEEFFLYSTNNSHVNAIDFDEDKQCVVIKCSAGEDPNLLFPFGSLALDGNLGFDYYNTEDYKAMVIIGRFDYDSVMFDPATKVSGTFYFTTDEDSTFSETKNLKYQYDRSDELQYIVLNFAKSRFWKGSITDCRFDFFERTEQDCEYEIYFFGLFENVDEANSFVAAYKEGGDSVLPTPEPTPEPTPTPEVTAAPEVTEAPAVTDAPKATDTPKATEEPAQNKGCGGFVAAIPAGVLTLAAALALNKKKRR